MDRKEEIIHAALELASEQGLKAVSMSRIAEKVGIRAPSLYNHYRSKKEIVQAMYASLREKALKSRPPEPDDPAAVASKSLEGILTGALSAYLGIISDRDMLRFFRVLYSERSFDPLAAGILLEETERMIRATRNLFYALAVHGKMKSEGIDTAAMTFALTVHALIDVGMDRITAGLADRLGDGQSPCTAEMNTFIGWFCTQVGGDRHEQEAH